MQAARGILAQRLQRQASWCDDLGSPFYGSLLRAAAEDLERILGTKVRIVELSEQRGRIEIEYYSQAELDRIYDQLARDQLAGKQ